MELKLEWTNFKAQINATEAGLFYSVNIAQIPYVAGVYVFGRRYANKFEALYVGKGNNVRGRVNSQC